MTTPRVLVVGDVIDDILVTISMPLRHDTDTPARIVRSSGGSAANTAVWLGSLDTSVDFVGCVGAGDLVRFRDEFERAGVRSHLVGDPVAPTGTIVIVIEGESRTMLTDRGANTELDFGAIEGVLVEGSSWVHLTGYSMFHHTKPESIGQFITIATHTGARVMMDASSSGFLRDFGVPRFLDISSGAALLRCNADEAQVLTGLDSVAKAVSKLAELYPAVVVTDGPQAVWCAEASKVSTIPVPDPVASSDPTGAGDAFNAGVLAGLAQGAELPEALESGLALARRCVIKAGARP